MKDILFIFCSALAAVIAWNVGLIKEDNVLIFALLLFISYKIGKLNKNIGKLNE